MDYLGNYVKAFAAQDAAAFQACVQVILMNSLLSFIRGSQEREQCALLCSRFPTFWQFQGFHTPVGLVFCDVRCANLFPELSLHAAADLRSISVCLTSEESMIFCLQKGRKLDNIGDCFDCWGNICTGWLYPLTSCSLICFAFSTDTEHKASWGGAQDTHSMICNAWWTSWDVQH